MTDQAGWRPRATALSSVQDGKAYLGTGLSFFVCVLGVGTSGVAGRWLPLGAAKRSIGDRSTSLLALWRPADLDRRRVRADIRIGANIVWS
jgi:hypothetical protein